MISYEQDEAMILAGDASLNYSRYRDTGCSLHPACLTCPRPVCVYDEEPPRGPRPGAWTNAASRIVQTARAEDRHRRIMAAWTDGCTKPEIAERLGLSLSMVRHHLEDKRWRGVA